MATADNTEHVAQKLAGKAKESAGKLTGDDELEARGQVQQAEADLKEAAGKVKQAGSKVKDAVEDALGG
jgi:uncharacterized protein YjbJ (UPF0337 family)